ncbi:MAG: T9SS type A sorting domain-containing protein [Vicingaceae bacterium]
MKSFYTFLFTLLLSASAFSQIIERNTLGANGLTYTSSSVVVSHTVGDLSIGSFSNSTVSVLEGFQQNSPSTTHLNKKNIKVEIKVFPNPTSQFLDIQLISKKAVALSIEVRDLHGKLIQTKGLNAAANVLQSENLDLSNLSSGYYLVSLVSAGISLGEAKIVKK